MYARQAFGVMGAAARAGALAAAFPAIEKRRAAADLGKQKLSHGNSMEVYRFAIGAT